MISREYRLFLRRWLKNPGQLGAIAPSSARLANAMARQVPRGGSGPVIELGGGTGKITAGLLRAGIDPARLVVGLPVREDGAHPLAGRVERFARRLEGRFKLPVARVDERFTSVEAESRLRGIKHKSIDSVAAQLILEQYFHEAA